MNVGSLFSGIGGLELGFERAGGFTTSWFVECEPHAQAILRKHWPKALIYADVTQLDFKSVPRVDILTGGFPCQDISNAGKKAGIQGSRSSLWKHYLRAIREIRPRYALIENVSALTRRGLDVVLCDLAEVGYDAEWHCVSASSVGAPHRRDRIFILAYPGQSKEQSAEGRLDAQREPLTSSQDVANTEFDGRQEPLINVVQSNEATSAKKSEFTSRIINSSKDGDVSDSDSRGLERTGKEERGAPDVIGQDRERSQDVEHSCGEGLSGQCESSRIQKTQPNKCEQGWWAVEPDVGRVANGVPFRVDRIKRLGNAVVPACAQVIAEAIKEKEGLT